MTMQQTIEHKITAGFAPAHLPGLYRLKMTELPGDGARDVPQS